MKQIYLIIIILSVVLSCIEGHRKITIQKETKDTATLAIETEPVDSVTNNSDSTTNSDIKKNMAKFNSKYSFWDFETKEYVGKLANPNFTGNPFATDKEYVEFITKSCEEEGVNFGGHYTIIQRSCGAMCEHIFIVDRKSGQIFPHVILNKDDNGDGKYGYKYLRNSKLLIANSSLIIDDYYIPTWGIEPELYVWTGKNFKQLNDWRVNDSYSKPKPLAKSI